jgi:pimeloyl-ACP methyl ester carboxylesterase
MPELVEIHRRQIEVAGGQLATFRFGPLTDAVPSAIAVHGITGSSRGWVAVARALGERAALIVPDLRGRGRSNGLPGPYGIDAHVRDLLALLDGLELDRAVLAGHSLGAYIAAAFAAEHPQRVRALVLVDGGLTIPGSEGADPQEFLDGFLGPALARLRLRFADREAYRTWWHGHPALVGAEVDVADLDAYADHDLVGREPELHSSVAEEAVRADAAELGQLGGAAHRLTVPATMLCAPKGLLDDPHPMQPLDQARAWAAEDPARREAVLVPGVNHYTIALGAAGAAAVADAIAAAMPG